MKIWNLTVKRGQDGSKHLDIQMHGVIDGGWMDDDGVDSAACIAELNQHLDAKTVCARINSVGGSVFGGVAMYNALQSHPGEVTCYVEGLAASAASLVAMAGKCVMGRGAMMMIHPPSTIAMGNAEELRKTADTLDKVQDAIASIYTARTGKSVDEINGLLDAETWMTAEEAVAAGFADSVGDDADEDGDEGEDAPEMAAEGKAIIWAGVEFPTASLPQQIIAMAKSPKPPQATVTTDSAVVEPPAPTPAPVLAVVPPPEPQSPITRSELQLRSPDLLNALLDEGRAAGVAEERARLKAIDDLGVKGCADLVMAAKYGEKPCDAPALAMAVVKAGQVAGSDLLAIRRQESQILASVTAGAPDQTAATDEARVIKAMVDGGNASRR